MHNSDSDDDELNEDVLYKSKGFANVQAALELMNSIEWKMEKIVTSTGDRIQSIQRKKIGKIYRLTVSLARYVCKDSLANGHQLILFFFFLIPIDL